MNSETTFLDAFLCQIVLVAGLVLICIALRLRSIKTEVSSQSNAQTQEQFHNNDSVRILKTNPKEFHGGTEDHYVILFRYRLLSKMTWSDSLRQGAMIYSMQRRRITSTTKLKIAAVNIQLKRRIFMKSSSCATSHWESGRKHICHAVFPIKNASNNWFILCFVILIRVECIIVSIEYRSF